MTKSITDIPSRGTSKNHIKADEANKLIHSYAITDAAVHDSPVFDELLDHTVDTAGNQRPAYAAARIAQRLRKID